MLRGRIGTRKKESVWPEEGRATKIAGRLLDVAEASAGPGIHVTFVISLRSRFRVFQMHQVILGDTECGKEGPLSSSVREIC